MKSYKVHLVAPQEYEILKNEINAISVYKEEKIKAEVTGWDYSFNSLCYWSNAENIIVPDIILAFSTADYSKYDLETGENIGYRNLIDSLKTVKLNMDRSKFVVVLAKEKERDLAFLNELIKLSIHNFYFADNEFTIDSVEEWLFSPDRTLKDNEKYIVTDIMSNPIQQELIIEEKGGKKLFNRSINLIKKGRQRENSTIIKPKIIEKEIITEKIKGTIFICFAGVDTNIGCTHAAYSTALYLSQQGYKTAYLEMCEDPIFYNGFKDDESVKEIEGGYTVEKNLDLYVKYLNGKVEYGKAVSSGYTYIVVDLGYIFNKDKKGNLETAESIREMEKAAVPILVGAGSKWQYENIVQAAKFGHDNWKLYINFADKENERTIVKKLSKVTGKGIYLAPYTPNCFKMHPEQDEFLELLLKDVLPGKIVRKPNMMSKLFNKIRR